MGSEVISLFISEKFWNPEVVREKIRKMLSEKLREILREMM